MFFGGALSAVIHLGISLVFYFKEKIQTLLLALLIFICPCLVWGGDFMFPGYVWSKYDVSLSNEDGERRDGRLMLVIEQGFEFKPLTGWVPHVGVSLYKPSRKEDDNYPYIGLKKKLLRGVYIGIEEEFPRSLTETANCNRRTVGYLSVYKEWK